MATSELRGKVAVITGAGRGIGRAIAAGYAEAGAAVCVSARTESQILDSASKINGCGGHAVSKTADVTNYAAVQKLMEFTRGTLGGIDIVVVNAGISLNAPVADSDTTAWRGVIDTNLVGAYHTVRAAVPMLEERGGGKIILLGSGLGHRGVADTSAYACSKAGTWMLTRVLAQELTGSGISVNELVPGPVNTAINTQDEAGMRSQLGQTEWIKTPQDVVPLALFLATQPDNGPTAQSFSLMRRDG